jgi:octaheme c-type cytochrome (tetrathionate reductase family)
LLAVASHIHAEQETAPAAADMRFRVVEDTTPSRGPASDSTADHSKFEELHGPFADGPEVTRACLSCHTEAGEHVMQSIHWTWEYQRPGTNTLLGKRHLVNTFCTNARGNEGMCAQCHISYGWKPEDFEPSGFKWREKVDAGNTENIDCLVCHDRTGSYYKVPPTEGNEVCNVMFEGKAPIDLAEVAQNVGAPGRENCGACHFYGGGGDGVKHGDLDSSLKQPDRALDVHMDADGLNFACSQCHVSKRHLWPGSRYHVTAKDTAGTGKPGLRRDVATCESCHGLAPHPNDSVARVKLNDHVDRVACQTCHIPAMARGGVATMTDWDWRTAGRTKNGEGYKEHDYVQGNGLERDTYKSIKGSFEFGENLTPHYAWFDGQMRYTTIDTRFDPAQAPVAINRIEGSAASPDARIWPFKRMHTVQPYDKGNDTLVYMHLWGDDADAYWGNYDFGRAIRAGMERGGLPYSGEFGFVETVSYWPITHMVAPKENALACNECHAREGRLSQLEGFYLPGRDGRWLDWLGLLLAGGTLLGVLGHALLRLFASKGRSAS